VHPHFPELQLTESREQGLFFLFVDAPFAIDQPCRRW
jgi:hypothetical protein